MNLNRRQWVRLISIVWLVAVTFVFLYIDQRNIDDVNEEFSHECTMQSALAASSGVDFNLQECLGAHPTNQQSVFQTKDAWVMASFFAALSLVGFWIVALILWLPVKLCKKMNRA